MSIFNSIDFSRGELPGWLNNLVALARPVATTMTVAIAPIGAFSVGTVAYFDPKAADAMASASIKFLGGIPDAAWGAIVAIALGYTAAKTAEVVKAPAAPAGRTPPEGEPAPSPPRPWSDQEMDQLRAATDTRTPLPKPQFGRADEELPEYAR